MYLRISLFLPGRQGLGIDGIETKDLYIPVETANGGAVGYCH